MTTRRDKTRIYYRLASEQVDQLWALTRIAAQAHLDNIDALASAYLGDREDLDEITRDELARRLDDGNVILVDVRPEAEYVAGHITGARSIRVEEIPGMIRDLPADADVVAYCRGPYCVFADDAVRLLRRDGRRASRLQDGYPEWRAAHLPTSTGVTP